MSSEKHPNLQLHKWAPTDYVKREEWNENFGIIDDKIGILYKRADWVSVKEYGAIGDGVFHKIRDVDPSITLEQVQSLNPTATLDNSIDWFAIQKAINAEKSVLVDGDFVIDLPIQIKQGHKAIFGSPNKGSIKNIGVGKPAFIIGDVNSAYVENIRFYDLKITGQILQGAMTGNGVEVHNVANLTVQNCIISSHGDNGLYSGFGHSMWIARFINTRFEGNKNNGVKIQHYYAYQKTNVSFIGCRAQGNGYNDQGQSLYQLNIPTTTYGHGIEISGVAHFIGAGTDCEGNSGAGVYLGGNTAERLINGITITGCYFEPNRLADIYIENSLTDVTNSLIAGNYQGSNLAASGSSQKGHLYISNPRKISGSQIVANKYEGNTFLRDMRVSSSLFIGGEFETENMFKIDKTIYQFIYGDGIKLTKDQNTLSSFISDVNNFILFNNSLYEIQIDYYWNKITPTSSILMGLIGKDYDFKPFINASFPNKQTTGYATLIQPVNPSDTVLYFDDLTGWDTAPKTHLNIYDTVLSNGYIVGLDFTHNFVSASNIQSIDVANKTITLKTAIGKTIAAGTKCSLGNDTSGSFVYLNTNFTITNQFASQKFIVDLRNVTNAKHIRYLSMYLALNGATDNNDFLAVRRIRIREIDASIPYGPTASRPVYSSHEIGKSFFDTTLNKPIWWNGSVWKDATGTTV
jgi:hypothetical protein